MTLSIDRLSGAALVAGGHATITPGNAKPTARDTGPPTHIYVIQAGGFCKVGITRNIQARLGQYRVHCPLEVKLHSLIEVPDPRKLEIAVHKQLTAGGHYARGEWFKIGRQRCAHVVVALKNQIWPPPVRTPEEVAAAYEKAVGRPRRKRSST